MRVYLSGSITLDPFYKEHFEKAEKKVKVLGFDCYNPTSLHLGENAEWSAYMRLDIIQLCKCDIIVMLKGWEESKGARVEYYLAKELGLLILLEEDL